MAHELDREEIRQLLADVVVALRCATYIHPEDLDIKSIIALQKTCRDVLPRAEKMMFGLDNPDDPIITDD